MNEPAASTAPFLSCHRISPNHGGGGGGRRRLKPWMVSRNENKYLWFQSINQNHTHIGLLSVVDAFHFFRTQKSNSYENETGQLQLIYWWNPKGGWDFFCLRPSTAAPRLSNMNSKLSQETLQTSEDVAREGWFRSNKPKWHPYICAVKKNTFRITFKDCTEVNK